MAQHEHSSFIKTWQQLVAVVVLSFIVPVVFIILLVQLVVGGRQGEGAGAAVAPEKVAERIKPVASFELRDASAPRALQNGEQIYKTVCLACHQAGVANAPKTGDKAAWAPLIKEGLPTLLADSIKGIRGMPPRGGNPDLTDTEMARAIVYMANQAGANWKEPEEGAVKPGVPDDKPGAPPDEKVAAAAKAAAAPAPAAVAPAATPAVVATAPAAPARDTGKGKSVYDAACFVCHKDGVAGAPKLGDKAAWASRISAGLDALYTNSLKGKGAMPPKGGNTALTDEDVKAAVDYMVDQSK